jgi:hypothetical protein
MYIFTNRFHYTQEQPGKMNELKKERAGMFAAVKSNKNPPYM